MDTSIRLQHSAPELFKQMYDASKRPEGKFIATGGGHPDQGSYWRILCNPKSFWAVALTLIMILLWLFSSAEWSSQKACDFLVLLVTKQDELILFLWGQVPSIHCWKAIR